MTWRFSVCVILFASSSFAGEMAISPSGAARPMHRGYELLTTKPYLPPDFNQAAFDEVWMTWEEPLRSQAEKATPDERRRMAFARYGLTTAPGDTSGKSQQYVVEANGNWTMNCLACHQGKVAGQVIPGAPNTLFALQTLTEEIRETKLRQGTKLSRMDLGSVFIPLGTSNGTTNAVMFGVALMARRDADLNVLKSGPIPQMTHHDHDAPPWWHFKKKRMIYSDGFASKGHRALMQFMLVKENGPGKFREWEPDFKEVYAWLESLEAPKYPYPIDRPLAAQGEQIFSRTCAECHGTYGPDGKYPGKIVPIDELGTDRVRLDALKAEHREAYAKSWFAFYGQEPAVSKPAGYQAPPLDGVWASAPYFHNGSVPTVWHVLHPDERPTVWLRSEDGYDPQRLGLEVTVFEKLPASAASAKEARRYFETTRFGKSAAGHPFADGLSEEEKRAVLEYLKTL